MASKNLIKNIVLFTVVMVTMLSVAAPVFAQAPPCYTPIGGGKIKVPCIGGSDGPANTTTFGTIVQDILNIALAVVGSVAVIFLVVGGFRYVTAHGNEEQAEAAKKTITHSIIGIVIVVLAFAIIAIISNALIQGKAGLF